MRTTPYKPKDFDDFWETRVEGWLLKDITTCVDQKVNIGGCTIIFCAVDFFGLLMSPRAGSKVRFYEFVEGYLQKINPAYVTFECKLYEDFRCGLVHEGIMKKGTGLFRSDDPDDAGYSHLEIYNNALWLDVIKLKKDILKAADLLKEDLDNNSEMRKKAIDGLRKLKWDLPKEE